MQKSKVTVKNKKLIKRKTVILYHKNCLDGFGAAWVAWKKFGNGAVYYSVAPHQLPDVSLRNADVYVCDSSVSLSDLTKLRKAGCRITVLDHHTGSESDIRVVDEFVFDPRHSGAMIAWKYFFPRVKHPRIIDYVEDGDLWNFKHKDTDFILNMLALEGFDFKNWSMFARKLEHTNSKKIIIQYGKVIDQYRRMLIAQSVERASLVLFEGHTVYAVNEGNGRIRSEVAHALYIKRPPFSIVWSWDNNVIHISLRSEKNGFDVSRIAKKYGGGGHTQAAGFLLPASKPFPWKSVKISLKRV